MDLSNLLQIFSHNSKRCRVITDINGKFWFVGTDLLYVVGYAEDRPGHIRAKFLTRHIPATELCSLSDLTLKEPTVGSLSEILHSLTLMVSESGLYAFLYRCRMPAAEDAVNFFSSEVLPAVRKALQGETATIRFGDRVITLQDHQRLALDNQRLLTEKEEVIVERDTAIIARDAKAEACASLEKKIQVLERESRKTVARAAPAVHLRKNSVFAVTQVFGLPFEHLANGSEYDVFYTNRCLTYRLAGVQRRAQKRWHAQGFTKANFASTPVLFETENAPIRINHWGRDVLFTNTDALWGPYIIRYGVHDIVNSDNLIIVKRSHTNAMLLALKALCDIPRKEGDACGAHPHCFIPSVDGTMTFISRHLETCTFCPK